MARAVVSTWYGTFLLDGDRLVRAALAPPSEGELAARARARRAGRLTAEDEEILRSRGSEEWSTRDRRLAEHGLRWDPRAPGYPPEPERRLPSDVRRAALLAAAEVALAESWDPSIHVEEAVRAAADLERVRNLVGERLGSWVSRDTPQIDPGDADSAARQVLEERPTSPFAPSDPAIRDARRRLAELYRAIGVAHGEISAAVGTAVPAKTPNLSALLGPELAARILAQARGLDRLARLPASTIQVLGAERAFFEHLRGNAPPPRHGLLFLHPAIQSASRYQRGKLARSLAGKVAIAARLDRAGTALNPDLRRAFEVRRAQVKAARAPTPAVRRRRSGKPLHATTGDR